MLATRPVRPGTPSPGQAGVPGDEVSGTDLQALLDQTGLGVTVRHVAWSASTRLERRVAEAFASGPVLLAGDAAHLHSPAAARACAAMPPIELPTTLQRSKRKASNIARTACASPCGRANLCQSAPAPSE